MVSFTPAIDDVIHIALADWQKTAGTVELRFSALLGDEEFHQFKKEGMKVQLWSDIPSENRIDGEWGEIDLCEPAVGFSESQISLGAQDFAQDSHLLSVICSIPFPRNTSKHYSFTYRLVYLSGEIKWFGDIGRDGHIDFSSRDDSGIVFEESWTAGVTPFVWDTCGRQVESAPVAQISQLQNWDVWSVKNDSGFFGNSVDGASLLFLVPRIEPDAVHCPKTVILSASPEISITSDSTGKLHASGSGSIMLHTYDALGTVESFFDKVLTHSSSLDCRLFGVFGNYFGLASPSASSSVQMIVIPLIPSEHASPIAVPATSLASVLGTETSRYTIFTPAQPSIEFVDPVTFSPGLMTFLVPPTGGAFVLSPIYSIPKNPDNDTAGSLLAILSPHLFVEDAAGEDSVLPTPPPSPHLNPVAHLTSSALPNGSVLSISTLGEQEVVPEIDSDEGQAEDAAASETSPSSTLGPTVQVSASPLVESHREVRSNLIIALMRQLLVIMMLSFSIMTFGNPSPHENREREQRPSRSEDPGNGEDAPVQVDETAPLLSREDPPVSPATPVVAVEPPESPALEEPSPAPSPAVSSTHIPPAPRPSLTFALLDATPGEKHSLILRVADGSLGAENISEKVAVIVNGLEMSLNKVKLLQEGTVYLDLDWDQPGRMVVRLL